MSSYKVPAVVGAVLLVFAILLSVVSNGNANAQKQRVQKIVLKYKKLSDEALKNGDADKAMKFAKLAIEADPSGKIGYACLSNAMSSKYKSAAPAAAQPATKVAPANAPSPDNSEDDELGC